MRTSKSALNGRSDEHIAVRRTKGDAIRMKVSDRIARGLIKPGKKKMKDWPTGIEHKRKRVLTWLIYGHHGEPPGADEEDGLALIALLILGGLTAVIFLGYQLWYAVSLLLTA